MLRGLKSARIKSLRLIVAGQRVIEMPEITAFYTRSSGVPIPHRVESADEVAAVFRALTRPASGVLLAVPIPESDELDAAHLDRVLEDALEECAAAGITGARITPFVLGRIADATDGRSIPANLSLAENNARVAAQVAVAIAAH
jgi:pseudouridine-5'-phosphate glycosidase